MIRTLRTTLTTRYVSFEGRATRREYWLFMAFLVLCLGASVGLSLLARPLIALMPVVALVLLLPAISVSVRRMQDQDRSAAWLASAVLALPLPLIWCALPGTPGANRFGPDPREPADA